MSQFLLFGGSIVFGFLYIIVVIPYLFSVYSLQVHLRVHEPTLWAALGRPRFWPFDVHSSDNKGYFVSCVRFFFWFLLGGKGAELAETRRKVANTRKILALAMFILAVAIGLFIGAMLS